MSEIINSLQKRISEWCNQQYCKESPSDLVLALAVQWGVYNAEKDVVAKSKALALCGMMLLDYCENVGIVLEESSREDFKFDFCYGCLCGCVLAIKHKIAGLYEQALSNRPKFCFDILCCLTLEVHNNGFKFKNKVSVDAFIEEFLTPMFEEISK